MVQHPMPAMTSPSVNLGNPDNVIRYALDAQSAWSDRDAIPVVEAALARSPGEARLWQMLGLLHRALEESEAAIDALEKAAGLSPASARIAHALARVRLEAGLPSAELFGRALELAPDDHEVLLGHAAALLAEGRVGDAVASLEDRLRRERNWVEGHSALTRLRWQMGERAHFAASLEQAIAAAPADVMLWRELIILLMHGEMYPEALGAIARGARRSDRISSSIAMRPPASTNSAS